MTPFLWVRIKVTALALLSVLLWGCGGSSDGVSTATDTQKSVTVKRDTYGVPHIYADDTFGLFYGMGYPRYSRGGAATGDWISYMFGRSFDKPDPFNYFAANEIVKVVENNPNASLMNHDPTKFQPQYTRLSAMIDATNPDLSAFANNGGKLLIWYGLGDSCVSVYRTADYLDTVKQRLGESKVRSFARMLTSPSIGHRQTGPGAGSIDYIAALDAWVE